jgi:hypothetical protein
MRPPDRPRPPRLKRRMRRRGPSMSGRERNCGALKLVVDAQIGIHRCCPNPEHSALFVPWGCAAHSRRANVVAFMPPTEPVGVAVAHNNAVGAPLLDEHPADGAGALAPDHYNAVIN